MANRENAIKGMKCCRWGMCFGCPYNDGVHGNTGCKTKMLDDVVALLEAMDVTPEELERLKKCRHECKIDCLLEHYEKIKAERDALIEAQEPQWTPITFRALTEEEKEEHPDWGFSSTAQPRTTEKKYCCRMGDMFGQMHGATMAWSAIWRVTTSWKVSRG